MKRKFGFILVAFLLSALCIGAVGCGGGGGVKFDKTKTQLFVFNFDGGFDSKWLDEKVKEFEAANKEISYQTDRKGVQVIVSNDKKSGGDLINDLEGNQNEVFFTETVNYYEFVSRNKLLDITDVVTGDLTALGDTGTIEDKLNDAQKAYYKSSLTGNKYYGIPHYASYFGITYDIDLFEREGFYFAADRTNGKFVSESNPTRSAGPDGDINATADNGLPATYEEFFQLCDYIVARGFQPLSWAGKARQGYLSAFMFALYADYEGAEDFSKLFTNSGEVNLITGFNGDVPTIERKTVSQSTGYEIYAQPGIYKALEFLKKMTKSDYTVSNKNFNDYYSHTEAQWDFLRSKFGEISGVDAIAMHVDGCFWECEASGTFKDLEAKYPGRGGKEHRNLGFMPLPKADASKVGGENRNTMVDYLHSLGFIKASIADFKKPLAKKFLQFVNTEQALIDFTKTTSTFKSLKYELKESDIASLTTFAKSIYKRLYDEKTDVVSPVSNDKIFIDNYSNYLSNGVFKALLNSVENTKPVDALRDGTSPKTYFLGIKEYYKAKWSGIYK